MIPTFTLVMSPFDVGQLFGDPPVPHAQHVDAPHMAALPVLDPGVHPADDAAIAGGEYLLGVEMSVRRAGEELLPRGPDALLSLDALTVRHWARILEDAVIAHERHNDVDVMTIEGLVESLHHLDGAAHCSSRTKYPDTRHPRLPSRVGTTVSTTCRPPETSVSYCSSTYCPGGALGGSVV